MQNIFNFLKREIKTKKGIQVMIEPNCPLNKNINISNKQQSKNIL